MSCRQGCIGRCDPNKSGRPETCTCHSLPFGQCPQAKPCLGDCGRKTTSFGSCCPGYCEYCAADPSWVSITDDWKFEKPSPELDRQGELCPHGVAVDARTGEFCDDCAEEEDEEFTAQFEPTPDPKVVPLFSESEAVAQRRAMRQLQTALDDSAERARKRNERWPKDGKLAMTQLAMSLPSLARKHPRGIDPWDYDEFLGWLCAEPWSHGEIMLGRFLLGVWNSRFDWVEEATRLKLPCPSNAKPFDIFEFLSKWDGYEEAKVVRAWLEAPFWP